MNVVGVDDMHCRSIIYDDYNRSEIYAQQYLEARAHFSQKKRPSLQSIITMDTKKLLQRVIALYSEVACCVHQIENALLEPLLESMHNEIEFALWIAVYQWLHSTPAHPHTNTLIGGSYQRHTAYASDKEKKETSSSSRKICRSFAQHKRNHKPFIILIIDVNNSVEYD